MNGEGGAGDCAGGNDGGQGQRQCINRQGGALGYSPVIEIDRQTDAA